MTTEGLRGQGSRSTAAPRHRDAASVARYPVRRNFAGGVHSRGHSHRARDRVGCDPGRCCSFYERRVDLNPFATPIAGRTLRATLQCSTTGFRNLFPDPRFPHPETGRFSTACPLDVQSRSDRVTPTLTGFRFQMLSLVSANRNNVRSEQQDVCRLKYILRCKEFFRGYTCLLQNRR